MKSVAFLIIASLAPLTLSAHSVADVESQLRDSERYAQIMDKDAPGFRLQDADGRSIGLEDFRGKAVIMNFIYARCREECPLHSVKVAKVQTQVREAGLGDRIQFLSIATDTEDAAATAEAIRSHADSFGLDPANWLFLYGGPDGERLGIDLAKEYGLEFVPIEGEEEQMHGVVTHLIGPEGRLRARYHGLRFDPLSLTTHAAVLVEGDHGGTGMADTAGVANHVPGNPAIGPMEWAALVIGLLSVGALTWVVLSFRRDRRRASGTGAKPDTTGHSADPMNG